MQPAEAACSTLEAFLPLALLFFRDALSLGAALCYTGINSQKVSTKHGNFNQSSAARDLIGPFSGSLSGSFTHDWATGG